MMSFYDSPSNKIDYLYMEPINMSAGSNMSLSFSVAHARYDATYGANDRLQVEVSTNCGQSWYKPLTRPSHSGDSTQYHCAICAH
jgi:hypothetical protein